MLALPARIKPTKGFSHLFYLALNGLLPILAYILVRINFAEQVADVRRSPALLDG
jgi:hypothetical protein